MKTIRTRISNKSRRSPLKSIRIHSNSIYSNRFQTIISSTSRYNNERRNLSRNLNITRQFLDEDDSILGEENVIPEIDTQTNETLSFGFEDNFQTSQSRTIEERMNKSYSGDYGPYFPNATTFMLFTWCTKHMISKFY